MRKQQLIQLLQFVFAWVALWLFVVFVMEESFIDFIFKYWLYLLIVNFSYFYYYSIQYESDKKYEQIRNVIIYGNIYLFAHIFFRPLLNISHQLFILLWLIVLWLWWTTKLTSRWKYLLQIMWWIISFFILVSGVFYLYPEAPDVKGFLDSRNYEILALWVDDSVEKRDAYVQVTDSRGAIDYEIVKNMSRIISEDSKITYPSLKLDRDESVVLLSPYWEIFQIFPQTAIQLQFSWSDLKSLVKVEGRIGFFSWVFDKDTEVQGEQEVLTEAQKEILETLQYEYKYQLVSYLKKQISSSNISLANNTIMYNIDGKLIGLLSKMFPVTFGDNLRNYKEFQKYFDLVDNSVNLGRYSVKKQWYSVKLGSIFWAMKRNMKIWTEDAYVLGWD